MTTAEAYLALNLLPNVGPVRVKKLMEVFGSPEAILQAKASKIQLVEGFGRELAETISTWEERVDLQRELRRVKEMELTLLTRDNPNYPPLLRETHAPPLVLYVWGEVIPRDFNAIGVVGSRQATHYGLQCAKKMSFQIAFAGFTVISGLARGIDKQDCRRRSGLLHGRAGKRWRVMFSTMRIWCAARPCSILRADRGLSGLPP